MVVGLEWRRHDCHSGVRRLCRLNCTVLYCTCYGRSEEIVPAGLDRFVSCDSEGETDIFIPDRVDTLSER